MIPENSIMVLEGSRSEYHGSCSSLSRLEHISHQGDSLPSSSLSWSTHMLAEPTGQRESSLGLTAANLGDKTSLNERTSGAFLKHFHR